MEGKRLQNIVAAQERVFIQQVASPLDYTAIVASRWCIFSENIQTLLLWKYVANSNLITGKLMYIAFFQYLGCHTWNFRALT